MGEVIYDHDFKAKAEKGRIVIGSDLADITSVGCSSAAVDSAKYAEFLAQYPATVSFTAPDKDPA